MNPQEPPSDIPLATSGQLMEQIIVDTSTKVDYIAKFLMIEHKTKSAKEKEPTKEKTRQMVVKETKPQHQKDTHSTHHQKFAFLL